MSEDNAEPTPAEIAELTPEEMRTAEKLVERALAWRALPDYSPTERLVLAILAADLSDDPKSLKTVMEIVKWLDEACGIEASEAKVRRDIHAGLELGPLPKW
jgi:bacterioferritin (cytochrome b1)